MVPETVSSLELGVVLGLTRSRIQQLTADKVLGARKGRYPLAESVQTFLGWKVKKEGEKWSKNRNVLAELRAKDIEQRMQVRNGELLDLAEHDAILTEIFGALKAELIGLPARVSRDQAVRRTMEAEIDGVLNRAAARIEQAAKEPLAYSKASEAGAEEDA